MDTEHRAQAIFQRDPHAPAERWPDLTAAQQEEYRDEARRAEAHLAVLEAVAARAGQHQALLDAAMAAVRAVHDDESVLPSRTIASLTTLRKDIDARLEAMRRLVLGH